MCLTWNHLNYWFLKFVFKQHIDFLLTTLTTYRLHVFNDERVNLSIEANINFQFSVCFELSTYTHCD